MISAMTRRGLMGSALAAGATTLLPGILRPAGASQPSVHYQFRYDCRVRTTDLRKR